MSHRDGFPTPPVFARAHPEVFGHRGGLALGPENTMLAFGRGLATGADGFECDVRLSSDGVPVVIHDATLERTTDAAGPVAARRAAELARVDATCRFVACRPGDAVSAPEGIPGLRDVLEHFPDARAIIELKDAGPAVADAVVALVRHLGAIERVCLASFHHAVVRRVRRVAPEIATGASMTETRWLLTRSRLRWPFRTRRRFVALQVPVSAGRLQVVSPAFVRQAHREHALVHVWTVNDPREMRTLLEMGVDGLITDRPDLALTARDAYTALQPPAAQ